MSVFLWVVAIVLGMLGVGSGRGCSDEVSEEGGIRFVIGLLFMSLAFAAVFFAARL